MKEDFVPNLDSMWTDDLENLFKSSVDMLATSAATVFFQDDSEECLRVYKDYGAYAGVKRMAMHFRDDGRIELALQLEKICEGIYTQLPYWAKW